MMVLRNRATLFIASTLAVFLAGSAQAAPVIDGSIGGSEGWLVLTEAGYGRPLLGGAIGSSDSAGESSTFNWYDAGAGVSRAFGDNRGDVINLYVASDLNFLYLAVAGPTAPFNSFDDSGGNGPEWDNDVGDLFVAIDVSGGLPSGSLSATSGHSSFGGVRAVDFLGWTPSFILGVQYVDNGGGGGGYANIEQVLTHAIVAGEGQNLNNGGFDWHATVAGGRAYDSFNGVAGEFEFAIPWAMLGLGLGGPAPGEALRFAMYTTQNFVNYDTFDSGPGFGGGTAFEQLGDNPGDPDDFGQLGPTDPGSFGQPGANFVADLSLSPSHLDGVDTIEQHLSWVVTIPEPGTYLLLGMGAAVVFIRRRAARR